jgi:hypothetical protein
MFGSLTSQAETLNVLRGQAGAATYLYSISYPKFGGESILHDPTYSMMVGSIDTTSDSTESVSETTSAIPGFEFIGLFSFSLVIMIRKIHKKAIRNN